MLQTTIFTVFFFFFFFCQHSYLKREHSSIYNLQIEINLRTCFRNPAPKALVTLRRPFTLSLTMHCLSSGCSFLILMTSCTMKIEIIRKSAIPILVTKKIPTNVAKYKLRKEHPNIHHTENKMSCKWTHGCQTSLNVLIKWPQIARSWPCLTK